MLQPDELIDLVAIKIAEVAVPDEVDLAPIMAQAFMSGGKEKEELFQREQGSLTGGFGPGGIGAIFPWILQAVATAAPLILKLLTTDVADIMSLINDSLDIQEKLRDRKKVEALPNDPYKPLKIIIQTISTELEASGLPQDQCDLITYRVLRALLDVPEESAVFVQSLKRGE